MESEKHSDCLYYKVCNKAQDNCEKNCLRYDEMSYLLETSGIPKAKQTHIQLAPDDCDLQAFRRLKAIKDDIVDFVEQGKNLMIVSSHTGNGKTSWAIKILLKYFDSIWAGNGFRARALFIHVPTLLIQLKDFNNPLSKEYKDLIVECDLVVWDDIVVNGMSQYDYNNLLSLLDRRILNNKSNIYTTNVSSSVERVVGERVASRLSNSERVEFFGNDRRYTNG